MQQAYSGELIKMDGIIMLDMDMSCLIAAVGLYTYTAGIHCLDARSVQYRTNIIGYLFSMLLSA